MKLLSKNLIIYFSILFTESFGLMYFLEYEMSNVYLALGVAVYVVGAVITLWIFYRTEYSMVEKKVQLFNYHFATFICIDWALTIWYFTGSLAKEIDPQFFLYFIAIWIIVVYVHFSKIKNNEKDRTLFDYVPSKENKNGG